jgi:RimJ/RimL family protein N-acetyltransferase
MKGIISAGISKFESFIPIYGVWGAINQISKNVFHIETMYRFEKELIVPEKKNIPSITLTIKPIFGDIDIGNWEYRDRIYSIRGKYGLEQFQQRFSQNYVMFCALHNDELVGFIWLNGWPIKGAGYKLKNDEAYHIDGWIFEDYRGKGILPSLQQAVFNYLRLNHPEIRVLIGHASTWNKPSIKGQQKAGLILVAKELSIVVLGKNIKFKIQSMNQKK